MGLVSYTEILGRIYRWNTETREQFYAGRDNSEQLYKHFNAFFDIVSPEHRRWRTTWETAHRSTDLYEALRSGLVHEYAPKVDSEFRMEGRHPLGLEDEGPVLVVEVAQYLDAFERAADELVGRLTADPNSSLPPTRFWRVEDATRRASVASTDPSIIVRRP